MVEATIVPEKAARGQCPLGLRGALTHLRIPHIDHPTLVTAMVSIRGIEYDLYLAVPLRKSRSLEKE